MQAPPTPAATIEQYELLLSGRTSREAVDRWAAQWVASQDPPQMDSAVWEALMHLCGCDLRHGPGQPYLHSDEQIREWMLELKLAVATSMGVPPNNSFERTREG